MYPVPHITSSSSYAPHCKQRNTQSPVSAPPLASRAHIACEASAQSADWGNGSRHVCGHGHVLACSHGSASSHSRGSQHASSAGKIRSYWQIPQSACSVTRGYGFHTVEVNHTQGSKSDSKHHGDVLALDWIYSPRSSKYSVYTNNVSGLAPNTEQIQSSKYRANTV